MDFLGVLRGLGGSKGLSDINLRKPCAKIAEFLTSADRSHTISEFVIPPNMERRYARK